MAAGSKTKDQIRTGPNDDAVAVIGAVNEVLTRNHGLMFVQVEPGDGEFLVWNLVAIETKHEDRDS